MMMQMMKWGLFFWVLFGFSCGKIEKYMTLFSMGFFFLVEDEINGFVLTF